MGFKDFKAGSKLFKAGMALGFKIFKILPYLQICDCLMLIRDYCGYLITNNYRIMHVLFDDYSARLRII